MGKRMLDDAILTVGGLSVKDGAVVAESPDIDKERAFKQAWNAALDAGKQRIRADCHPCEGTGHADAKEDWECEYCGRPMVSLDAIRAKPDTPEPPEQSE